jgi:NAD-dependent DNA ligase
VHTRRAEAHNLVLKGSVTKSTKLLIVGSTKGTTETSKQTAAKTYGTNIIDKNDEIEELERLIQQAVKAT